MPLESNIRARIARFGTFEVDVAARELRKSGVRIRVHGQPFEVLALLLDRPGETVSREELRQRLWPTDTLVDFDHGVNTAINRLREALGDSAENPRFVETVPRRGYRFFASVEPPAAPPEAKASASVAPPSESNDPGAVRISGLTKKTIAFAISLAIAVVAILVFGNVRQRLFARRSSPNIQSIAVPPLTNLSGDANQDYFADGLTDALITDLGKISAIRVISRTSVMQYKGTRKSLPEIARELNVDALIEGTVVRSGDHLRITANLLLASPEKHLWAESYDSEVGDVLALQSRVAQAVAREIQVKLTPEEQRLLGNVRPVNPKAHDEYLKGRFLCTKNTREGVDQGIQYFQKAIEVAPTEPLAYAGLADCYGILAWAGDISAGDLAPKDAMPKAREAALKALEFDTNLAEAYTALGLVELTLDWNWSAAEREFKRAIELNPNYSLAHALYAHYLVALGRFDEGIAEAKRSLELDPFAQFTLDFNQWAFYLARQYDLTLKQSKKALELAPEFPWAHYDIAMVYEQRRQVDESIQEFLKAQELFGLSLDRLAELRKAYQLSGEKGYWRKTLKFCGEATKLPRKFASASGYGWCDYAQNVDFARLYVHLGELDAAFASLRKACVNREGLVIYLDADPDWDIVRSDSRFRDLVRRVGLPQ
jgi:TolB-like protein/DNA-binding winged helix-turn-helix (wHTH) protein/Flp pilus assembly protein TadD